MIRQPDIARVSELIRNWFGLHYPEKRWPDLARGIRAAGNELGFSEESTDFLGIISNQEITPSQLDVLAAHLTIGETYFFRERQVIEALREEILPRLIQQRAASSRALRIWSAGCCSGEEPYSIAMILSEMIPDITSWHISILATDLNQQFLAKARQGIYSRWSFRDTPPVYLDRYFTRQQNHFILAPRIRQMVTFRHLNLVTDPFPADNQPFFPLDIIFCRNVLMYFTPEIARHTGERMVLTLDGEGCIITSQVELTDDWFPGMQKVRIRDAFVYRKSPPADQASRIGRHKPEKKKKASSTITPIKAMRNPLPTGVFPATIADQKPTGELPDVKDRVRMLADRGELEQALTLILGNLQDDRENVSLLYLAGVLLLETGKLEEAGRMLTRTLYLCPDHAMARYQQCIVYQKSGEEQKAGRLQKILLNLLASLEDDYVLPDGDGLTAGALQTMINHLLL